MSQHPFILLPGDWYGEGKIVLNMVEEFLPFSTSWNVTGRDYAGKIQCMQGIQIHGLSENMTNDLSFYDFQPNGFTVEMENSNIGRVIGKGVYDDKVIAWEFRDNELNFEGFETYVLQSDGSYSMHGEYVSSDQFRTEIEGKIWPKPPESQDMPYEE